MSTEIFGMMAGLVNVIGFSIYIYGMVKKGHKPDKVAWWVWSALGVVEALYTYSGAWKDVMWLITTSAIIMPILATVSIWYGEEVKWTRYDVWAICACGASFLFWVLTRNSNVALALVIMIDLYGLGRVLKSSWKNPESEDLVAWIVFIFANGLSLFAIKERTFLDVGATIYYFVFVSSITTTVLASKIWHKIHPKGGTQP